MNSDSKMVEKVREIIRKESDEWSRKYHIPHVVKNAKILARKLGTDEELVELAALIHDIGMKFGNEDHEITGAKEAEKILKSMMREKYNAIKLLFAPSEDMKT